ncbi:MAG: hypothetical protein OXT72_04840 [Gammaproteobacteria bacterium]|nr:hypothetical protein [Gammaproteobacteria bacterium]MDE0247679.1 hypothetical protein [Gammaproteobacteria bacterium]
MGEEDERTVSDLPTDQVVVADVIRVNRTDLVTEEELAELTALLRRLNVRAQILPIERGRVAGTEILGTGLFDFEEAPRAPGWMRELTLEEHTPATDE